VMSAYMERKVDVSRLTPEQSLKEFLEEETETRILSLSGATLDEVLYFVYRGTPVYAMKNGTEAVLLTGYSASQVTVYEPSLGRNKTYSLREAEKMFEEAGNIYIGYLK